MIRSAPLRFVVAVLAVWTGARTWILWPDSLAPAGKAVLAAADAPAHASTPREATPHRRFALVRHAAVFRHGHTLVPGRQDQAADTEDVRDAEIARLLASARGGSPLLAMLAFSSVRGIGAPAAISAPLQIGAPKQGRWSGYGWVFLRDGNGKGLADAGQLGGSQLGLRIDYALTPKIAVTGRFSSALDARGREAALGLRWKPFAALPVMLVTERRIAVDGGGRDAFAAMAAGGVGPVDLPARFKLGAYGQAGIVGLRRRDGFVDGAATVVREMAVDDRATVGIGGGVWGAAQPGVSRLDAGPRIGFRFDGGRTAIGASLDWRQRVAGTAAPRSGIALTIDGSF